jgi:hypothetical protein
MNMIIVLLAAGFIPLIVGFLWYNNSFGFGKAWMAEIGMTEEELQRNFNPMKVFGFAYLFGVFLAFAMMPMTIHQMGFMGMLQHQEAILKNPNSELSRTVASLMSAYGNEFRYFGHGVLHGVINSIFLGLPLVGITALFERRSWKYIFIHLGYWVITFALVGGTVCQFTDISGMFK